MEQPIIILTDTHGKKYGEYKVTGINFDNSGSIIYIDVGFCGSMRMYCHTKDDIFLNTKENIIGVLKK